MMKKRVSKYQTSLFGQQYAYLVVISPPDEVINEIQVIKKELNSISDISDSNLFSIPHITLTDHRTDDIYLPETIEKFIEGEKSFPIQVKDWGIFQHGTDRVTIYLKIVNPEAILNLIKKVKSKLNPPHLTLAKDIPISTYEKLIPYLNELKFSGSWNCDKVTVLKKLMAKKHLGFKEKIEIPLLNL